jgi:hypothetical protein
MKQASALCFLVIGQARSACAGQLIVPAAYQHADQAAPAGSDNETKPPLLLWYDILTSPINILSIAGLAPGSVCLVYRFFLTMQRGSM